jgi:hypothetical protein
MERSSGTCSSCALYKGACPKACIASTAPPPPSLPPNRVGRCGIRKKLSRGCCCVVLRTRIDYDDVLHQLSSHRLLQDPLATVTHTADECVACCLLFSCACFAYPPPPRSGTWDHLVSTDLLKWDLWYNAIGPAREGDASYNTSFPWAQLAAYTGSVMSDDEGRYHAFWTAYVPTLPSRFFCATQQDS